jgi:hypothetical protein
LADGEVRARQFVLTVLRLKKVISRPRRQENIPEHHFLNHADRSQIPTKT